MDPQVSSILASLFPFIHVNTARTTTVTIDGRTTTYTSFPDAPSGSGYGQYPPFSSQGSSHIGSIEPVSSFYTNTSPAATGSRVYRGGMPSAHQPRLRSVPYGRPAPPMTNNTFNLYTDIPCARGGAPRNVNNRRPTQTTSTSLYPDGGIIDRTQAWVSTVNNSSSDVSYSTPCAQGYPSATIPQWIPALNNIQDNVFGPSTAPLPRHDNTHSSQHPAENGSRNAAVRRGRREHKGTTAGEPSKRFTPYSRPTAPQQRPPSNLHNACLASHPSQSNSVSATNAVILRSDYDVPSYLDIEIEEIDPQNVWQNLVSNVTVVFPESIEEVP